MARMMLALFVAAGLAVSAQAQDPHLSEAGYSRRALPFRICARIPAWL